MVSTSTLPFLLSAIALLSDQGHAFIPSINSNLPTRNIDVWTNFKPTSALRVSSPMLGRTETASSSPAEVSSELLSLVLDRWNGESKIEDDSGEKAQIDSLIEQLVRSEVQFDENECLWGPFYATLYTTGTKSKPLWEKLSNVATGTTKKNLLGQRYFKDPNGEGKVINYSEVYGRSFHIRADGDCAKRNTEEQTIDTPEPAKPPSPMDGLTSFISKIGGSTDKDDSLPKSLAKCPIDYLATVKKGSFNLFGKNLDLPIQGTGIARLLYADPKLRIFQSVSENDWEDTAGLEVVQVRIDLVDPEWQELS